MDTIKTKLKYYIFKYTPSIKSTKSVNLGILCQYDGITRFFATENREKIKAADSEFPMEYMTMLLNSFKIEFASNNKNSLKNINAKRKLFQNEFAFQKPVSVSTNNVQKTINDLKNTLL